ncbi:hypothetical protein PAPYR_7720 [Paratrimastix pyriformis]|uniref:Protein kinase A anchor protein nuclear localisation signal domain-containing protein n=1 Tax=Paratrimastix pyriformis TaxID=342808 RepID=A0ABQ8UHJ8_9EUKA|nr:hypothetical protein PAPYR_7720 [Paratrimastix pyriformis]
MMYNRSRKPYSTVGLALILYFSPRDGEELCRLDGEHYTPDDERKTIDVWPNYMHITLGKIKCSPNRAMTADLTASPDRDPESCLDTQNRKYQEILDRVAEDERFAKLFDEPVFVTLQPQARAKSRGDGKTFVNYGAVVDPPVSSLLAQFADQVCRGLAAALPTRTASSSDPATYHVTVTNQATFPEAPRRRFCMHRIALGVAGNRYAVPTTTGPLHHPWEPPMVATAVRAEDAPPPEEKKKVTPEVGVDIPTGTLVVRATDPGVPAAATAPTAVPTVASMPPTAPVPSPVQS